MKYLKNVWRFGYLVYLCTIKKHDYIYISEIFFSNQAYNKRPEFDRPNLIERLVFLNYVKGANVAGFMKVAKAMTEQGIV